MEGEWQGIFQVIDSMPPYSITGGGSIRIRCYQFLQELSECALATGVGRGHASIDSKCDINFS